MGIYVNWQCFLHSSSGISIFMFKHKTPLNFERCSCCALLAMFSCDRDKVDKGDQVMSVSYTKGTEEVNILSDRDQSAPLNGEVT